MQYISASERGATFSADSNNSFFPLPNHLSLTFLLRTCVFVCLNVFFLVARCVCRGSEGSTGRRGAGMRELRGSGHQPLLRDADEVDDDYLHTDTHPQR